MGYGGTTSHRAGTQLRGPQLSRCYYKIFLMVHHDHGAMMAFSSPYHFTLDAEPTIRLPLVLFCFVLLLIGGSFANC